MYTSLNLATHSFISHSSKHCRNFNTCMEVAPNPVKSIEHYKFNLLMALSGLFFNQYVASKLPITMRTQLRMGGREGEHAPPLHAMYTHAYDTIFSVRVYCTIQHSNILVVEHNKAWPRIYNTCSNSLQLSPHTQRN